MGLYDAVPVPMMQPEDIVRYLRSHFPNLIHLFSDPENLDPTVPEPYNSSSRLAEEMLRSREDTGLLESFYSALNEMAVSHEYWMQETLGDLLEGLIHDEAFVARLRPHLNAQAKKKLEAALGRESDCGQMLRITLNNPADGWAYALLTGGDRELVLTASYTPTDAISDLIEAVERLQTATSADCCWFQEPGELHWKLRRVGSELEIEILKFDDGVPGEHWRESVCIFTATGNWLTFARQLLSSLEAIRVNLGTDGYQRAWRRPFPTREQERLRATIKESAKTSPTPD
jgi:hypothetical protein